MVREVVEDPVPPGARPRAASTRARPLSARRRHVVVADLDAELARIGAAVLGRAEEAVDRDLRTPGRRADRDRLRALLAVRHDEVERPDAAPERRLVVRVDDD